jgi:hypothetical protein
MPKYNDDGIRTQKPVNGRDSFFYNTQGDIVGLFDKTGTQVVSYSYDTWNYQDYMK